jgi:DNA polymerase III epsilon subunit-like protein
MTRFCFVDVETTGLGPKCEIWDLGVIVREDGKPDAEYSWLMRPDMTHAEPTGVRIGRYYQRIGNLIGEPGVAARCVDHPVGSPRDTHTTQAGVAAQVARFLDGAFLVGAVTDFDARHLTRWLGRNDQCGAWNYHIICVENHAAGQKRMLPPWNLDVFLNLYEIEVDPNQRHTALGDARLALKLYDAVMGGGRD